MAPSKFGLFKSRSKEQSEQPSVENLLPNSDSTDTVATPSSPSHVNGSINNEELIQADLSTLSLDDLTVEKHPTPTRRASDYGKQESSQIGYKQLKSQPSAELKSSSTLQDEDFDLIEPYEEDELSTRPIDSADFEDHDGASTSYDANSLLFDESSLAPSEDFSVNCGALKKQKKSRSKEEEQLMKDCYMWHASNIEVMQNLLYRSGTQDDQMKWQAIATSRGLCTLTDSCSCCDCRHAKFLAGVTDGDGGLGTAPLFSAINMGCSLQ